MSEHPSLERLQDGVYGFLPDEAEAELRGHAEACPSCGRLLRDLALEREAFAALLKDVDLPPVPAASRPLPAASSVAALLVLGLCGLVVGALLWDAGGTRRAGPASGPPQEVDDRDARAIAAAVVALDADDPDDRLAAQKDLRRRVIGPAHAEVLRKALASAGDEARERGARLLATWRYGRLAYQKRGRIWTSNPDGSDARPVTPDEDRASCDRPVWSPDGARIAYLRTAAHDERVAIAPPATRLCVMEADGSRALVLTGDRFTVSSAAWSPRGDRLAYVAFGAGDRGELRVVGADGSGDAALADEVYFQSVPAWSPDGREIAYEATDAPLNAGRRLIRVVPAAGGRPRTMSGAEASDAGPAWSPDGSRLAFVSGSAGHIRVVGRDGTRARTLTPAPGQRRRPRWSPDGGRIFYVSGSEEDGPAAWRVCSVPAEGGEEIRHTGAVKTMGFAGFAPDLGAVLCTGALNLHVLSLERPDDGPVFVTGGAYAPDLAPWRDP